MERMRLYTQNLVKKYRSRTVVKGASVEVSQGEIVGLLGPNGAGKTTTFYMMVGLVTPNAGSIFLDDIEITSEPVYRRAQRGIGYLAQEASVFRKLSVEDNLKAVLEMTTFTKEYQREKVESLLNEFGLQRIRKSLGIQLSGGERRRTDIQSIVGKLKEKNIGILITDHNVHETLSITDRAYLLFEGEILKAGSAQELADDPEVRKVYLGQNFELRR